ncbi:MAG TPA: hypothetical protein VMV80_05400 [Anaerolineales bacterium]|nr:hypothetical protein [Anaerolineales bacterium]
MAQNSLSSKPKNRTALLVLWGGILFSLAFTGLIWWAGGRLVRDWRTPNSENVGA